MANLKDKAYMDWSGGIRRDVSPYLLKDNQLVRGRNFEIDNSGRIVKRRGSIQFGQAISGVGRFYHSRHGLFAATFASPTVVYKLLNDVNTANLTTASTSIALGQGANFDTSGTVEINGDLVAYGAGGGSATLTSVTGIGANINAWSPINQWQSIGTMTGHVGTGGVWFSFLNDRTCILSEDGASSPSADLATYDGTNIAAVASMDVSTRFLENFRDRLFTVGSNTSVVYYSDLGAVSFPATIADNSFEIEDDTGEDITGIKQYRKNLIIFKPSATYAFPGSLPIRQLSRYFGLYSDACIQEINGLLYGIGTNGTWVSNGVSFVKIDKPVEEYIRKIQYNILSSSVPVLRLKTAQWNDKFIIYVNNMEEPDTLSSLTQFTLVYDTKRKSWEVIEGMSAPLALGFLTNFRGGGNNLIQNRPILLYSDGTNVMRAFENRTMTRLQTGGTGNLKGGDLYAEEFRNIAGTPITMNVVTKPFDLGLPHWRKTFGYLKVFCENPQGLTISVSIDGGDPIVLGQCKNKIERFKFPANTRGYRCQIIIDESSTVQSCIFNGVVFEECKIMDQNA